MSKKQQGKRYNQSKLRWHNVPLWLMEPVVEVGHFGEQKYDSYNFLKGLSVTDTLDSLKRHLSQLENPNVSDNDHESGLNHLAHVAWNAIVALHFIKTRPDLDDRYKGYEKQNSERKVSKSTKRSKRNSKRD